MELKELKVKARRVVAFVENKAFIEYDYVMHPDNVLFWPEYGIASDSNISSLFIYSLKPEPTNIFTKIISKLKGDNARLDKLLLRYDYFGGGEVIIFHDGPWTDKIMEDYGKVNEVYLEKRKKVDKEKEELKEKAKKDRFERVDY